MIYLHSKGTYWAVNCFHINNFLNVLYKLWKHIAVNVSSYSAIKPNPKSQLNLSAKQYIAMWFTLFKAW